MKYFDAHCHVQLEQYDQDREVILFRMQERNMGGIIVGTILTLLFLPALYVTWFGIRPEATATHR